MKKNNVFGLSILYTKTARFKNQVIASPSNQNKGLLKYLLFILLICLGFHPAWSQSVFLDDYASNVTFAGFGGSTNNVSVDNTVFHSGTASLKAQVTTGYTGGALVHASTQNLSSFNCLSFWVKASRAATLNVSGLGNNAATAALQTEFLNIPLTTAWVKVIIPIPDPSKYVGQTGLFHFAEGSDEGAYTIWFDDIQYENLGGGIIGTPTVSFATETVNNFVGDTFSPNGIACSFPVNGTSQNLNITKGYLTLTSSNTAVVSIDATSTCNALAVGTATITGKLGAVNAGGIITANVSAAAGSAPTIAASNPPARVASDVISLYSGVYTDISGTDWFPNWGQSTVVTDLLIGGNNTKKYSTLNYQGVQFASAIDASQMTKLHVDIWTPNCTAFDVYLINTSPATVEQKVTLTPTLSGWNSFDILLSQYNTIALNNIGQFKLVGTPFGTSTVYLDNFYFYKDAAPSAGAPTAAASNPPVRATGDVISLFSGAYTDVAGTDWFPNWGQSTVVSDTTLEGNATKKYSNLNYQGVQFASAIDASQMEKMHIDIWTPNCNAFDVYLINTSPATVEQKVTLTPTLSGWNSFDILLSQYNTIALNNIGQLKLVGTPFGTSTVYFDNVYFYKEPVIPMAPLNAASEPPARAAGDVISLFSGAYTDVAGTDWFPNWGQSTIVSDTTIEGNATKKYTNLNYQGVQFASAIDASQMTTLHIDIWTPNCTAFDVYLINTSPVTVEQKVTLTPTLSGWNTFDILLSQYNTIALNNIGQLKLVGTPFGTSTVYFDNVYFYRGSALPVSLLRFDVYKQSNSQVALSWATTAEVNNDRYVVERSTDGIHFGLLQTIAASSLPAGIRNYQIVDATPLSGRVFYRLSQVDIDGRTTILGVKSIEFKKGNSSLAIYPNPVSGNMLQVDFKERISAIKRVELVNANGVIIEQGNRNIQQGLMRLQFSSRLAAGVYWLKVEGYTPVKFLVQE